MEDYIFQNAECGILLFELDDDLTILQSNDYFYKMYGLEEQMGLEENHINSMKDMMQSADFVLFHGELYNQIKLELLTFEFEIKIRRLNGSTFWGLLKCVRNERKPYIICTIIDIDKQKSKEEKLQLSLDEALIAIQQSDIYFVRYHVPTKMLTIPLMVAKIFGIETTCYDVPFSFIKKGLITNNINQFIDFYEAICRGEPSGTVIAEQKLSSGDVKWFEYKFTTIFDIEGQPLYGIISFHDITKQREQIIAYEKWMYMNRSQKAENCHYYEYNITKDILEIMDGSVLYRYPDQLERTFSGVIDYIAKYIIHPEDKEDYVKIFTRDYLLESFHANRLEIKTEHRCLKQDGTHMRAQTMAHLYKDPYNADIHCFAIMKDLDEVLEKMKEELQIEATNLLNDCIPGGIICAYNKPGYPLYYINDDMINYLGFTYEEFEVAIQGFMINIIPKEDREQVAKAIDEMLQKGNEYEINHRIQKKDLSVGWMIMRGRKSINKLGQEVVIGAFVDITEIVTLQEELKVQANVAAIATKMKSEFLANMSHEIRTPMNGIIGFAELTLDDQRLSKKTRDYIEKIKISAISLLDIINDILDISKIETEKMELERIEFSLHDILKQCETISSVKAEEKGIALYFHSEPYIWNKFIGDPTKIRQILLNLLSNAIKFTNQGIVKMSVLLEEETNNKAKVHFVVKDTGIGMTKEQVERVFDPFMQADSSTTRKYGGTGLGLSISKSIIEMMGSTLFVESTQGIGSKFSFSIVFEKSNKITNTVIDDKYTLTEMKKPLYSGEVLVCEDNAINQQIIKEQLFRVGLVTTIATNGKIGLDLAKERMDLGMPYDLIFMDIHMPIMDGLEATKQLIKAGNKTPIIALTANAMDKENYMLYGMSNHLAKPFSTKDLWQCLRSYLVPISYEDIVDYKKIIQVVEEDVSVIDRKLGIHRAADDEKLYQKILTNFMKENKNIIQEVEDTIKTGDNKIAHRLIHTIKGTAALIGAISLSKEALAVENLLLKGDDILNTPEFYSLKAALNNVFCELESIIEIPRQDEKQKPFHQKVNISDARILIEKIEPLLNVSNADCIEYLEEIVEVLSPLGESCDSFVSQIDNYDFELAYDTLMSMKEMLVE